MFSRILIANRGEIACRIIATCRRLGIVPIAVYSDADARARHVRLADEAWRIGPPSARESYLNAQALLQAARDSGAQAIHPGYGFLSESAQFAQQVLDAGLVFIGPPVPAMQAMSSKASARELMQGSGVPVLPGYQGERQDPKSLAAEAERIGYPVLIKAVAGGGGKGMRLVSAAAELPAALAACRREAAAAFGEDRVLLERYVSAPRHIEVQVFADMHGHVVHLFERDCSAQRRHQKVVEEAPAPRLAASVRAGLFRAAVQAARAVGYCGAGTVEFLVDAHEHFYFIEMNTRIQVEHAVTEMVSGVDMVEWQIRIAGGEALPGAQEDIRARGHAIEARLYAEVPEAGFLPASGTLRRFELPPATKTLRIETGVESGDAIGIDYDPLLAKIIARAGTRRQALAALQSALARVRIEGVGHNVAFLQRLLDAAAFRAGRLDTGFLERSLPQLAGAAAPAAAPAPPAVESTDRWLLAAAALFMLASERAQPSNAPSPWGRADGWRLNGWQRRSMTFDRGSVTVQYGPAGVQLVIGAQSAEAELTPSGEAPDDFEVRFGEAARRMRIVQEAGALQIAFGAQTWRVRHHDPLRVEAVDSAAPTRLAAPMPGRILAHLVDAGATVARGTALLVMEAMKMEHTLCAPAEGVVRGFRAEVGAQVQEGAQLIDFEPQDKPDGPAP